MAFCCLGKSGGGGKKAVGWFVAVVRKKGLELERCRENCAGGKGRVLPLATQRAAWMPSLELQGFSTLGKF